MSKLFTTQLPLKLRPGNKTDVRAQLAALCWRIKDGKLQICLVTSRNSGRWILPKGWPMHKQTPAAAAATEAFEEAGVSGIVSDSCLGAYSYIKPLDARKTPVLTLVYPLHVQTEHDVWPEKRQRRRKWFGQKKAAKKLVEPELQQIVSTFQPQGFLMEAPIARSENPPI